MNNVCVYTSQDRRFYILIASNRLHFNTIRLKRCLNAIMDTLSAILLRFKTQSQVFFSGNLCELSDFDETKTNKGHLHLLRSGALMLINKDGEKTYIDEASALFFPQGRQHRIIPDPKIGADLVCATLDYGEYAEHPIALSLPTYMSFSFAKHEHLNKTAYWLFDEAFSQQLGRETMINKLCDLFIVQILREVLLSSTVSQGMLAGLSHEKISHAINAMHLSPQKQWQVQDLADLSHMSRAKFAALFTDVVGHPPLQYLTQWRMRLVKDYMLAGDSVEIAAQKVGYLSASALARVFGRYFKQSPKQWLKAQS